MKRKIFFVTVLAAVVISDGFARPRRPQAADGYPLSNFSLTVNASENGDFFGEFLVNPGKLGDWLEPQDGIAFAIEKGGKSHPFSGFAQKTVNRSFPFVRNTYQQSDIISARIEAEAFCPLGINDLKISSMPTVLLTLKCTADKAENFNILVTADSISAVSGKSKYSIGIGNGWLISSSKINWKKGSKEISIPVALKKGETRTVALAIEFRDAQQVYTEWFKSPTEAGAYALDNFGTLREKTLQFSDAIPVTGDAELDKYLRWYMVPGIALTKCTNNDEVLTMGYCELNQRDSYWTSWLHLVMYKDLERKMLLESIEYQQESGKIPTTILPLIERNDDIDINAFFILRDARYYRYYKDIAGLRNDWQALKKAMNWLISRDKSGNGLPEQVSFWGDWKDVRGVKDRRYSPFSGLIYLAALKEMIFLGKEVSDNEAIKQYSDAYDKGYGFINKPVEEGGLWNGEYYCQIWKDGTVNTHLLQDQTIGILFGVVPADRSEKIIQSLNNQSLTLYGIAETTPYYPESFGYKPATYHNGAVWPWLSFMDCWARAVAGHTEEAVDLVKKVAHADLVASGDWSPNEHINSLTGENLGFKLQGWNAGLYGFVYFGLLHKDLNVIPLK